MRGVNQNIGNVGHSNKEQQGQHIRNNLLYDNPETRPPGRRTRRIIPGKPRQDKTTKDKLRPCSYCKDDRYQTQHFKKTCSPVTKAQIVHGLSQVLGQLCRVGIKGHHTPIENLDKLLQRYLHMDKCLFGEKTLFRNRRSLLTIRQIRGGFPALLGSGRYIF